MEAVHAVGKLVMEGLQCGVAVLSLACRLPCLWTSKQINGCPGSILQALAERARVSQADHRVRFVADMRRGRSVGFAVRDGSRRGAGGQSVLFMGLFMYRVKHRKDRRGTSAPDGRELRGECGQLCPAACGALSQTCARSWRGIGHGSRARCAEIGHGRPAVRCRSLESRLSSAALWTSEQMNGRLGSIRCGTVAGASSSGAFSHFQWSGSRCPARFPSIVRIVRCCGCLVSA